ncbi:MAG: DbpA RNA binding domain-containing protein [Ferruginibacter sp.]
MEFSHFLKYYENAEDLNSRNDLRTRTAISNNGNREIGNGRRERGNFSSQRDTGYTRLFINIGTKDGFYKASFLQFILDESNLKKEVLGRIDMKEMNSWIEIDASVAGKMIKSLDGKKHNGRLVRMNEADGGFKKPSFEGDGQRPHSRERRY